MNSPWNKGLTKETDVRVAKSARQSSLTKKGKPIPHLHNAENYQKVSKRLRYVMKKKWQEPHYRKRLLDHLDSLNNSPEQIVNASKGGKAAWAKQRDILLYHLEELHQQMDSEFYREIGLKGLRVLHAYPNKQEAQLFEFLESAFPGEWKYVGNGQVPIGNLRPDFINTNGKKLIIEFFGDYWHDFEDIGEKEKIYAEHGYRLLVIWSNELKDSEYIVSKVSRFMEEGND